MPTPPWSPRRSAISAHLLIQFGIDRGLGLEQCLAGSGLDIRLLGDPSGEIDAAQELSVVRNLVRHLGDACAPGLAAGLRYHLNATASGASPCSAARPSSAPRNWACATST